MDILLKSLTADNSKMKERIKFISILQTLAIILVVIGHSLHEYDSSHGTHTFVYQFIYSFHMPLFVFISGYLLSNSMISHGGIKPYRDFVKDKAIRLLLPYTILTVLTFLPRVMMNAAADDVIEISPQSVLLALFYSDHLIIVFFWFLPMLFILFNVIYGVLALFKKQLTGWFFITAGVISLALNFIIEPFSITFLSLSRVSEFAIYFLMGMAYCKWQSNIDRLLLLDSLPAFLLLSIAHLICFRYHHDYLESELVCATIGIGGATSLSQILARLNVRMLDHLDGYSYTIFLLSWYFNVFSQQVLHHFTEFHWWVYSALSVTTGIYMPLLIGKALYKRSDKKIVQVILFCLGEKIRNQTTVGKQTALA